MNATARHASDAARAAARSAARSAALRDLSERPVALDRAVGRMDMGWLLEDGRDAYGDGD